MDYVIPSMTWEEYLASETGISAAPAQLSINGVPVNPMADTISDLTIPMCSGDQTWTILKEYAGYKNVNIFGYYTDTGVGNDTSWVFSGPASVGASLTTSITGGTVIGLWLHSDVNNDQLYNSSDAFLFSERSLSMGAYVPTYQFFKVYDVSAYKGTGATYEWDSPTEDFNLTGDYDYLLFMDDNHAVHDFDHNDIVVGMLCENAPPVAICQNVTVNADANCEANASIDNGSYDPDGDPVTIVESPVGPYALGITTVTLIITDDNGAADTCQSTVTVVDVTPPIVTCPSDITIGNDAGQCGATVTFTPTATDNCAGVTVTANPASGTMFALGTTPVEVIATDGSGNADTCYFNVTVNDTEDPVATCPSDITVGNDAGQCGATVTFTPTATDNCSGVTVTSNPASGTMFALGTTQVEVIATDGSGNADTCYFNVTVNDTEDPVATCPSDIIVGNDAGQCGATVTFTPTATDNCSGITITSNPASGTYFTGTTQVEVVATDGSGNADTCYFNVTVNDTEDPVATCPADITVGNDAGQCGAMVTFTPTATDNCSGVTVTSNPASGTMFALGTTQV
ncbi:MAG: HYR domain-containing protein, partial [FCB group bacterium]|nr:HYR domain-containing protein [FCB group bacterium]